MNKKSIISVVIAVFVVVVLVLINPLVIIRAGERGVVLSWGAVTDRVLDEGIHWLLPIRDHVAKMDVKVQKEEKATTASSKDLQIVTSRVAVNYHVDPLKVNKLWQEVGKDYSNRIIAPAIEEFTKKATAQYTAEQLITKREDVKDELKKALMTNLAKNNILLDDIFITDFKFSVEFDKAIESKVTAEQRALESKNKLEQVKYEAEQRVTKAKAEAESIKIQAQAITQQGGKDYVQLKAIEKWDGKLPAQMIPNATVPFLDLTK